MQIIMLFDYPFDEVCTRIGFYFLLFTIQKEASTKMYTPF